MKRFLAGILPTVGPVSRWLRRAFAIDRRYGVRFASGNYERVGFYNQGEAEAFLEKSRKTGVVFFYDPAIDLRLVSGDSVRPTDRYVGSRL